MKTKLAATPPSYSWTNSLQCHSFWHWPAKVSKLSTVICELCHVWQFKNSTWHLFSCLHNTKKKSKSKYSVENFDSATEGCESFMFSQRGNGESSLLANLVFHEERGLASCLLWMTRWSVTKHPGWELHRCQHEQISLLQGVEHYTEICAVSSSLLKSL